MKTLSDGTEVSSRSYYYLLDWNEVNEWRFMADTFKKAKLNELTFSEYKILFSHATKNEFNSIEG